MGKLWKKEIDPKEFIVNYTVGNDYILDQRLIPYDCEASIAHAKMLNKIGILSDYEKNKIIEVLKEIVSLWKKGNFSISVEDEDSHTKIENYLTRRLGEIGEKIHTARSRNDQVLTALRLYYKEQLKKADYLLIENIKALQKLEEKYENVLIPGFTHTRKAMPTTVKVWLSSFEEALKDDRKMMKCVFNLIDASPLGTAAGYGVPILKIDRELTQKELNFGRIQENPIYAQNSRGKFEAQILSVLSSIMWDVNKLSSDIIFLSEEDIGIIKIPTEFTTGSSIMPQKKNPDIFEIARANYSKVVSLEIRLKMLGANLISGYHRDLQLTKEAVFEGFDITLDTLEIFPKVIKELKIDALKAKESISPSLFATEEVYRLVKSGTPFREAYKQISKKYS